MHRLTPRRFGRFLLKAGLMLGFALGQARAQLPSASDLAGLAQQGYLLLDRIDTQLLAVGDRIGDPHVAAAVLYFGRADLPAYARRDGDNLASRDEFARHDALQHLQPLIQARAQQVAAAKGFLMPVRAGLGPYDFTRQRFPLELALRLQPRYSDSGYYCAGGFALERNVRLTNCVEPTNWNRGSLAFEYLAMDSERAAEQFKRDFAQHKFVFFFLVQRDGADRGGPRRPLAYGFLPRTVVRSLTPVRVLGLLVLDRQGHVLSRAAMPGT